MNNNNNTLTNNHNSAHQLVMSYELLCLLRWLLDHDVEKLKKIVSKALVSGLKHDIKQFEQLGDVNANPLMIEEIQYCIIEFFSMLEIILAQSIKEQAVQRAIEKNLMPTIDHIDSTICDTETVRFSMEKATARSEKSPKENAQTILFKEILRNWKPSKNMMN
jgi:hypothetical protein